MEKEIKLYQSLNELAAAGGCVIFGGTDDRTLPLGELKEAFALQGSFYNRSFSHLSLDNAAELYDTCVAPLAPKDVFLHIGEADLARFQENATSFDRQYTELVQHILRADRNCRLTVVALKNPDHSPMISQLNQHLEVIARNETCAFCDIAKQQVWNPRQTKEVVSFLYAMGFVRPLKQKPPVRDLAKILFCCVPETAC